MAVMFYAAPAGNALAFTVFRISTMLSTSGSGHRLRPRSSEIRVRRFVETNRFHDSVVREFIDDEVDEMDLVGAEGGAVEVVGERLQCGLAVQADKRADKQSQTMGFLFGPVDGVRSPAPLSTSICSSA